ncbi:uncharacterized protein LOC142563419 [Dermacentor variabilis]|uniref:uncharacterized protein LOC142563419 n=1 Tax=Dermacentor variabilis TaxID=34621 RepID=UPI003F5C4F63
MSAGRPPEFADAEGTWPTYRVRLEAYFEALSIVDPTKKRALLIASLTDSAVRVVQGRCQPKKVNELSYEEVVGYLEDYYAPEVNEIAASYAFFMRSQQDGEAAQDFIADIRRLAEKCNFGTSLERMLRDRIACGVLDEDVRRHLLTRRKLTLEEAADFAVSAQRAVENARSMSSAHSEVHFARQKRHSSKRLPKPEQRDVCGRCGESHAEDECKHLRAVCHRCGKRGHLRRMCLSSTNSDRRQGSYPGRQRRQGSYAMAAGEDTSSDDNGALHTITAVLHHAATIRKVRPIYKDISWNNVPLTMLVDTGSPVSVIPVTVFRKYKQLWPPLESSQLKLSYLLGELPVVGQLSMTATCDGKDIPGTVIVVDSSGPSLWGRDTIKAFNEVGVAMLSNVVANLQPAGIQAVSTGLQQLLDEYADVFAPGLGLCKGPPVTFQLKENACPRFFKARTVPYALRDKMSESLDQLVAEGVLTPVKTAEWATPVVPILKGDGSLRLCGDFRMTVNAATVVEQYPLPRVDDIFARLNGGEVFTTLDLRQAYNQLPLDEEAKKITVLNTQKGVKWQWSQEQEKAFQQVKQAIVASKFLAHFDLDKPLRLECDASSVGIGAVLSHRVNGVDYPIGFWSRTLTKSERNYSQLEKEALALVFGVARFKDCLYGHQFVLVTDHKPLTGLFNPGKAIPPMAAARIQRWALFLGNYNYTLQYRKGSDHSNADALSRLPLQVMEEPRDFAADEYVLYAHSLEETALCAREVEHLTNRDTSLLQVKKWISQGWPSYLPQGHEHLRPYFNTRTELTVSHNLVYWGHRIILPLAAARRFSDATSTDTFGLASHRGKVEPAARRFRRPVGRTNGPSRRRLGNEMDGRHSNENCHFANHG